METREHRIRDLLLENQPERSPEFWPWLGPLKGNLATKKQANKFLLGCMVDYRKKSELVWRDVRTYIERTLEDPEDLWGEITKTAEKEWKTSAHHLKCSLHPLLNRHEKIWTWHRESSTNMKVMLARSGRTKIQQKSSEE